MVVAEQVWQAGIGAAQQDALARVRQHLLELAKREGQAFRERVQDRVGEVQEVPWPTS